LEPVKTVVQSFRPEPRLHELMEQFRQMVNRSIAIGLETGRTSLKSLSLASYHRLRDYATPSKYRLCAISRASGILKNYRNLSKKHKVRTPYCRRPGMTICYGLKITDQQLYMPGGFQVPLNKYTQEILGQPGITVRSATLTASKIGITYSRRVEAIEAKGVLGVDRNLNNATAADCLGNVLVYDLSRVTNVKSAARSAVARFRRDDSRVRRRIASKYGRIQRAKTGWLIHNVSKKLADHATSNRLSIALENIRGIRRLYRRGNGQGRYYRGIMNSWSSYELGRQLSYKAAWNGLGLLDVNSWGTSSECSVCGDRMVFSKESRMLHCPTCGVHVDRDVNAARNICSAGLRFSLLGLSVEALKGNPPTMVIPGVDDSQPSPTMLNTEQPKT
jgi:putative transposase